MANTEPRIVKTTTEARQGESGQKERALMFVAIAALFVIFGGLLFYYLG